MNRFYIIEAIREGQDLTQEAFDLCMQRIKSGDKNALKEIYEAYLTYIYTIIYGVVGSKENAEDITSEFFIRLWKTVESYTPGGSHKGYLATIARNMALDFLRKNKREILTDEIPETEDHSSVPEKSVVEDMSLTEALDKLNEKERLVVSMKILSEMTFEEISKELGIPMGTITWRYRNAIEKLRRCGYE